MDRDDDVVKRMREWRRRNLSLEGRAAFEDAVIWLGEEIKRGACAAEYPGELVLWGECSGVMIPMLIVDPGTLGDEVEWGPLFQLTFSGHLLQSSDGALPSPDDTGQSREIVSEHLILESTGTIPGRDAQCVVTFTARPTLAQ